MKPKRLVPFLLVFVILVNSVGLVLADDATPYTYDANGNLISDGVQCFSYNDANQLAAVRTCAGNVLVAEYVYDHTGQRIIENHNQNGALQETVYTIGKQAETVVAAGGARQDTTYFRANSEIIARGSADGSKTFYHQDHLGSTGTLTDAGGQVVEETRYYPFGMVRTGGALSRFLYTGQESDAETGLYYYGARFYDPALARFVQPDSMLPEPYDPQQLNRYALVANNPIKYVDPSGHKLELPHLMDIELGNGYSVQDLANNVQLYDLYRELNGRSGSSFGRMFEIAEGADDISDWLEGSISFGDALDGIGTRALIGPWEALARLTGEFHEWYGNWAKQHGLLPKEYETTLSQEDKAQIKAYVEGGCPDCNSLERAEYSFRYFFDEDSLLREVWDDFWRDFLVSNDLD